MKTIKIISIVIIHIFYFYFLNANSLDGDLSYYTQNSNLVKQNTTLSFKANQIIDKVSKYRNLTESRDDEFLIDTSIVCVQTAGVKEFPAVAFDGTNYLVVWHDLRNGSDYDIYGARVDQSGVVLDTGGIAISTAANTQWYPSIAFDGTNYLVVWENEQSDFSYDIHGARVSQSGALLDSVSIAISSTAYDQKNPSIAFDGTNYLVVWWDQRNGSDFDVYGARVDQSGAVLNFIIISPHSNHQWFPSVAFDGTNYLVVWADEGYSVWHPQGVYGARLNQTGAVLDTNIHISHTTLKWRESKTTVAFNGIDYLVMWQDNRSVTADIYGAKLNTSGVVIDSFAAILQAGDQISPALAHGTDGQLLITYSGWTDSINVHQADAMRIWGKFYPFEGIGEIGIGQPIMKHRLYVYPNPFSKQTNIKFQMKDVRSKKQDIFLKIYDISGRIIKSFNLISGVLPLASAVIWDGTDNSGKKVSSGVYFIEFKVGEFSETRKLLLIK